MSIRKNIKEICRLVDAFAHEAGKFHVITFRTYLITQDNPPPADVFSKPNHAILLWQYYGSMSGDARPQKFVQNLKESDLKWGIRGAEASLFGVIEGKETQLFVRMAKRAGSLFNKKEADQVRMLSMEEILPRISEGVEKPAFVSNNNPLSVWLNYLLAHISKTNPGMTNTLQIEPDPFTLSLIALERLLEHPSAGRSDRSKTPIRDIKFKVALSFPGEKRAYVAQVAEILREQLPKDSVFYDFHYQAQLARPNLDTLLQQIYSQNSELVVVFLCKNYAEKEWCGLEWRAIRELIKKRCDEKIMFVRFDNEDIEGALSIDGYIDAEKTPPNQLSHYVLERLETLSINT